MEPKADNPTTSAELPLAVIQAADIGRLSRELSAVDENLLQLSLRQGGDPVQFPKTSRLLEQVARLNGMNLMQAEDRKQLLGLLAAISRDAPVLHMSFSVDPTPAFLEKLITWMRREIHPQILLSIGLQPTIGAGCVVRSTNKQFDFSLRQDFLRKRDLLKAALAAAGQS